jgi:hypothetical protein
MAQNRKPPAFQEYAASFIASKNFRLMSLEERGLLMTMRFECWENLSVPSNRATLAKYLGLDEASIPLTDRVLSFFITYEQNLICPELEDYRMHIKERREKQSKGGKKGAKTTNEARASRRDTCESLDKLSLYEQSQKKSVEMNDIDNKDHQWISDYESAK